MTKTGWIIGAVVIVGAGIAAGLFFFGGGQPDAATGNVADRGVAADTAITESAAPAEDTDGGAPSAVVNSEPAPVENPAMTAESNESADGPVIIATLDDLFANAATYSNKEVVARGTIVTQCISGCTFSLEDGTGVVAVDLVDDALDHVLEGGSVGRQVEVRGIVETSPQLMIVLTEPDDWNYID